MNKKRGQNKRYKAIIFDLDGTLINSMPYHFMAFQDLLLEHKVRISQVYLKKLIGLSTRIILSKLKQKYHFKESIEQLREERRYHYFKFLGEKEIVFPGVRKELEKLRLNYKLAIATGSSYVTFSHSVDKDFIDLFENIVTIDDVNKGRGKPKPDQLLKAARKLKVRAFDCLVVGDSLYDAIASKRAHMDFFGVLTGFTQAKVLKKAGAIKVLNNIRNLSEEI